MALTKEFEYDCEVSGHTKNVQVRKATIVKDDGVELVVLITGTYCIAALSQVTLGAIQTSVVRTQQYKQCATQFGQVTLNLLTKHL